jgi:hypothetical protein
MLEHAILGFDNASDLTVFGSKLLCKRMRGGAYGESSYAYRGIGEGIFGALTVKFEGGAKARRR